MGLFVKKPLPLFIKLAQAGTLLGAVGLCCADSSWGQDDLKAPAGNRQVVQAVGQRQGVSLGAIQPISNEVAPAELAQATQPPPPPPAAPDAAATTPPAAEAPAEEPEEPGPWGLTDLFTDCYGCNRLKDRQWKIGGNLVQSVTFNFSSPNDRFNGPVTWTDRSNDYQVNQLWLYAERATQTSDTKCWDIGGRADILWGTNARFDTEAGLEDNINRAQSFYGLAIPQFYMEVAYKDTKTKFGHFISPVGYFTVDMTQNFFNTIPYTYQYGEPFTHTGMLTTWNASDKIVLGGGFTHGWDSFDGSGIGSPSLGPIGTATYTFCDKSTLAWVGLWSREPTLNFGAGDPTHSGRYFQTLVYSKPFCEKWNYVAQTDFGTQGHTSNAVGGGTSRWYGLNQYIFYTQNECWQWGFNFEWFRDEEGFRVGGFLPNLPNTPASSRIRGLDTARAGFAGNFYQMTMGPKWNWNKNMFLRPNVRVDWYGGGPNANGLLPYGDGEKHSQGILATDLVILY